MIVIYNSIKPVYKLEYYNMVPMSSQKKLTNIMYKYLLICYNIILWHIIPMLYYNIANSSTEFSHHDHRYYIIIDPPLLSAIKRK